MLRTIRDYLHQPAYRKSLNDLSIEVFRHELEPWYKKDFFKDKYIPYSIIDGEKVIANVSISLMELMLEGEKKRAIQISTVMTGKKYRRKGYIQQLMEEIIDQYEEQVDLFYLFANDRVVGLYPKFGFRRVDEYQYVLNTLMVKPNPTNIRLLHPMNEEDRKLLKGKLKKRVPVSNTFSVLNDEWPLAISMLDPECTYLNRYYLPDEDVVVLASREENELNIYDIISQNPFSLDRIVEKMVQESDRNIVFHFMPELEEYNPRKMIAEWHDETLFIRTKKQIPTELLFPLTSHI